MALELDAKDIEKAKFAFSIYDFEGNNTIDAVDIGKLLRALDLVPTQKLVEKVGGTKKRGVNKLKIDDFLPIYAQVKMDKDIGNREDFLECLHLYDKKDDGMIAYDELKYILVSLGEQLDSSECSEILADCVPPPNEDGLIPYKGTWVMDFIDKLMAGPKMSK